jgi:hypothetical protein
MMCVEMVFAGSFKFERGAVTITNGPTVGNWLFLKNW